MNALSAKAAANCENAKTPVCRCRCGGRFHGSARMKISELPLDDPHSPSVECQRCKGTGKLTVWRGEEVEIDCYFCKAQGRIIKNAVQRQLKFLEGEQ